MLRQRLGHGDGLQRENGNHVLGTRQAEMPQIAGDNI